jgi:cap1 methyltransferase
MQRMVFCEVLIMSQVLRTSGHFVCKTFELASDFSLSLLFLLYHAFEKLSIVKPVVYYYICVSYMRTVVISRH